MSPWTVYLINQLDMILATFQLLLIGFSILIVASFIVGSLIQQDEKVGSDAFVMGQTIRAFGFRFVRWTVIGWLILAFIPTSQRACASHPHCVWTTKTQIADKINEAPH